MAGRGRGGRGGGGGGPQRGRGGTGPARGGGPSRGSPATAGQAGAAGLPAAHVQTIGVKRKAFGTSGQAVDVWTNHFPLDIPTGMIYHYDTMTPSEQSLPLKLNMDLIRHLQEVVAPGVFTPRAVYDGRKNMFAIRELPFTDGSMTFDVSLGNAPPPKPGVTAKPPKVYKIKITKVAEINPEVLSRFLQGAQTHDNDVLTAITALNVVVRHEPTLRWPFNVRSFFTDAETRPIGAGIVLWRGYFQSVRPGIGRMLMNIDIATATMYRPGPLIELCLEHVGKPLDKPQFLSQSRGLPEREFLKLQRFIQNLKVTTPNMQMPRAVKKLQRAGANSLKFTNKEGKSTTVAQYFQVTYNKPLRFPDLPCAELGSGALLPIELCIVPPGQIMRKQVPPDRTKDVLDFATIAPEDRLSSIKKGLGVLQYGQSEYVRQFGLHVHTENPVSIKARILQAPNVQYGNGSIQPRDGVWNMVDRKFFQPSTLSRWGVMIFETQHRYTVDDAKNGITLLVKCCRAAGMTITNPTPPLQHFNSQGNIHQQIKDFGIQIKNRTGNLPELLVFILPDGATDLYTAIKHACDIQFGVASQCLKAFKAKKSGEQYFANVVLKVNVKLGGINAIPGNPVLAGRTNPTSEIVSSFINAREPVMILGADVIHPAAHSEGRPSFTALVASVDPNCAKYVATSRVQTSRQEMIDDLQEMAEYCLDMYAGYRRTYHKGAPAKPKKIVLYRDGVSEGQFKQVIDIELPRLKAACAKKEVNATISVVVVGKRHHVRFFPKTKGEADRSGNCKAGTVVDTDVTHPTDMDFYLQSHAGLKGTSRPAHYNVLYDENGLDAPNTVQALSYALCCVYARSTRSVSIPAPVYYADIVCSRAKTHYAPENNLEFSETQTFEGSAQAQNVLEQFKTGFKPLHVNTQRAMYFT